MSVERSDNLDDMNLLIRWRDGDRKAGQELVSRHYASLARFLVTKVGPEGADLIQETFEALPKAAERFRGEATVRTLIFSIARNKLKQHYRYRSRSRGRNLDPEIVSLVDTGTTPTGRLAREANKRILLLALRRLRLDDQIILELRYWEEMSHFEIAEVFSISKGNARVCACTGPKNGSSATSSCWRPRPSRWSLQWTAFRRG